LAAKDGARKTRNLKPKPRMQRQAPKTNQLQKAFKNNFKGNNKVQVVEKVKFNFGKNK
jgi:hypothetical protein